MQDIEIDGVVRCLGHLKRFVVTIVGKGKDNADLRVAVSLGRHTVSKSCSLAEQDMQDENGKPRQFCEDRYAFSLGLPELARRMLEQNYFCWESTDRNRGINYAILDVAPGLIMSVAKGEHWVIFFYLYPGDPDEADVNLVVTSCHKRTISVPNRRNNMHARLRRCLYTQKRVP